MKLGLTARLSGQGFVAGPGPAAWHALRRRRGVSPPAGTAARSGAGGRHTAMTWAELHGVLRGKGLIRADDAMRAEAAVGVVRSIAYDSRKVERGRRVRRAQRPSRRRDALRRTGDRARRGGGRFRAAGAARHAVALGDGRGRPAGARRTGGRVLPPSQPRDAGHRHHRNQRQDDDGVPDRFDLRCGRPAVRTARHRRLPNRRRSSRGDADDARSARSASDAQGDGRSRLPGLRDGGVVARASRCAAWTR